MLRRIIMTTDAVAPIAMDICRQARIEPRATDAAGLFLVAPVPVPADSEVEPFTLAGSERFARIAV